MPSSTQYSHRVLNQSTSDESTASCPFHFGSASSSHDVGASPAATRSVFQLRTNVLNRLAVYPSARASGTMPSTDGESYGTSTPSAARLTISRPLDSTTSAP